jgi:hypothetical protein
MKLRSFIPPGTVLELDARLKQRSEASAILAAEARAGKELLATSRLALKPEVNS